VNERLRNRTRHAVRAARDLVESLREQSQSLQTQAQELERAKDQAVMPPVRLINRPSNPACSNA